MSGGFFRGTSADQDTRFSNKQAKLMKSQKFPPELEHLVDISKVKMDVIKPWIATRVTELLGGFEDEVLINFIYGLLEGKEINGKAIQIQLTGFMEKNTSKFMKELWALLLSAEKNASGVPQQFLDAKEEETKKKKAESDRIFNEIQRRKEKELDQEKEKEKILDGGRGRNSVDESKRRRERGSDAHSGDENGTDVRNGFRERKRSPKSSHPGRSPSPLRGLRSRSISKSYSNSRSPSKERSVSRSVSPMPRKHSVSPARMHRVPRRSVSPRRPSVRQSISPRPRSQSRKRSPSRTRYRSPSPMRRRVRSPVRRSPFPVRRRSPSPFRRRSRSPLRRRSPPRHRRSPSPWRRRSPSPRRRRSPSPVRQWRRRSTSSPRSQSPVKRRSQSPLRRRYRSPVRRRSPYSVRRRSPSLDRRGSPSPRRRGSPSVVLRRSPPPSRRSPVRVSRRSLTRSPSRSLSPDSRSSASPGRQTSALPVKMRSPRRRSSLDGSPIERTRVNDRAEPTKMARRQSMAMSPQRDHSDSNRSRRKVPSASPSPAKSPSYSPQNRDRSTGEKRRLASPYKSPKRGGDRVRPDGSLSPPAETKVQRVSHGSPGASEDELQIARAEERIKHKPAERTDWSPASKNEESPDKPFNRRRDNIVSRQDSTETPGAKEVYASKGQSHGSSVAKEGAAVHPTDSSQLKMNRNSLSNDDRVNSRSDVLVGTHKRRRSPSVSYSGSEGSGKPKSEVVEKKKHKRSSRRDAASDSTSSDSEIEDRKEAKRRKKEARKLRKEDRHQRREERHRRREEKRASKRKRRSKNADASSSDVEKKEKNGKTSNGDKTKKYSSEEEETESQKKRLEIELREKALESLRAKKGISR